MIEKEIKVPIKIPVHYLHYGTIAEQMAAGIPPKELLVVQDHQRSRPYNRHEVTSGKLIELEKTSYQFGTDTHKNPEKEYNEDSALATRNGLIAVFDGISDMQASDVFSELGVRITQHWFEKRRISFCSPEEAVMQAMDECWKVMRACAMTIESVLQDHDETTPYDQLERDVAIVAPQCFYGRLIGLDDEKVIKIIKWGLKTILEHDRGEAVAEIGMGMAGIMSQVIKIGEKKKRITSYIGDCRGYSIKNDGTFCPQTVDDTQGMREVLQLLDNAGSHLTGLDIQNAHGNSATLTDFEKHLNNLGQDLGEQAFGIHQGMNTLTQSITTEHPEYMPHVIVCNVHDDEVAFICTSDGLHDNFSLEDGKAKALMTEKPDPGLSMTEVIHRRLKTGKLLQAALENSYNPSWFVKGFDDITYAYSTNT